MEQRQNIPEGAMDAKWEVSDIHTWARKHFKPPEETAPKLYKAIIGTGKAGDCYQPRSKFEIEGEDIHTVVVTGPEDYMAAQGNALVSRYCRGKYRYSRYEPLETLPTLEGLRYALDNDHFFWHVNNSGYH